MARGADAAAAGPRIAAGVAPTVASTAAQRAAQPSALPLDLPRLVMRRAGLLAAVVLALAVVLGVLRMNDDIAGEVDAAMGLAGLVAQLGGLGDVGDVGDAGGTGRPAPADDRRVIDALRQWQSQQPLRHLELRVMAADGRLLLGPPPAPATAPPLRWLLALHQELLSAPDSRQVSWRVPRPGAAPWTVSLAASHDSERREAMGSLLGMLALLLLCVAGLLLVMRWNLRHAFAPLGRLLDAIAGIEAQQPQAVSSLPTMPIRELEAVAAALRHLGAALASAETQRRLLSQQVLTLQEDERARLARELHDEFGQRLTALRVDAAWLARRVAEQPALKAVVDGMSQQCERVQLDIRSLLTRLQPFAGGQPSPDAGPNDAAHSPAHGPADSLLRLTALLESLVASWASPLRELATQYRFERQWCHGDGSEQACPDDTLSDALQLPQALLLAIYRISQEALTNAARHADARHVVLCLRCQGDTAPGSDLVIDWSVRDDGVGLPVATQAMHRGNGIAGIQQRVWAQGGALQLAVVQPGPGRPGLRLSARFMTRPLLRPATQGPR